MTKHSRDEVARLLGGSPALIDQELKEFSANAAVLSADHAHLIDKYAEQWVGIHNGRVELVGDSFEQLKANADQKRISLQETIVRYIERDEKTLILNE